MRFGDAILAATTILPAWIVLPLSLLVMLVTAGHVLAVHQSDLPFRRRRIRVVNGILMLLVTGMLAYALGMAEVVSRPAENPAATREFVLVWISIIGLLGLVVGLAGADAAHTLLHGLGVRRQLRQEMREHLAMDLAEKRALKAAAAARAKSGPIPAAAPPGTARRGQDARRGG